jgi:uncharacterized protein YijF (DUF1287 family)
MSVLLLALSLTSTLPDRGIYPEFNDAVSLGWSQDRPLVKPWLRMDPTHHIATLYDGADPLAAWPGAPPDEVRARLSKDVQVVAAAPSQKEDRDGDGIVDRLDIALGAKKLIHNKARYIERYVGIPYPGGDVPRTEGVCTDTVIRALRNAGIDLQREVHEDILAARKAYPMVEKVDPSINHRRVRTVVRWFERHWQKLSSDAPYLPGDVVFFDTFPSKPGPDHLGVVSDTVSDTGHPMIINNWTDGAVDAEMDLLSFVPVTHHFRAPSPSTQK